MGVHYLVRNLEKIGGKLPFKITFNDDLESDKYINDYKDIGVGILKYIGIDGSVIIHSKISTDTDEGNNTKLDMKESASRIVHTILQYIQSIIIFFNYFNNNYYYNDDDDDDDDKIVIVHFVIDGKPPCTKNRRFFIDEMGNRKEKKDAYSLLSLNEKDEFHKKIFKFLKDSINAINKNKLLGKNLTLKLSSNHKVDYKSRGEGEIELYKVCKRINEKYSNNNNKKPIKNVIISSDSDVISLMLLNKDSNLVVISPLQSVFITNLKLILKALNFRIDNNDIIKYNLLHFIFFGSDYNLGLMSTPTDSKQQAIIRAIRDNDNCIDNIGGMFIRRKSKKQKIINDDDDNNIFLQKFKIMLIYEAICSLMYYYDLENGIKYLTKYSPRLYEIPSAKNIIPLITFKDSHLDNTTTTTTNISKKLKKSN